MRILVVTSCTGAKIVKAENSLTLADFQQGPAHVARREAELAAYLTPAERLYSGRQHVRLMHGLRAVREQDSSEATTEVDLWILSGGYGLVRGNRLLAPYEATFQGMRKGEARAWADTLGVPKAIREVLHSPYDLAILLLGDSYLAACALDESVQLGGPTILFCGSVAAKRLPSLPSLRAVPLRNPEARRFSCGLIGLKGELTSRLLEALEAEPSLISRILDPELDILALLDRDKKPAGATARVQPHARLERVDWVIKLPPADRAQDGKQGFRYFIPDSDDLVDPDYDFLTDTHSGGGGNWSNEVYAHQLYPTPNYDGILISKVAAEKSAKKKRRINELGVHRYLRVPDEFPIMGDCGAFGYISAEVPPYTTDEILEYYTRLGFNYGVSVDHLIVTATEEQKRFRYDLTIHNAEQFLVEHRKQGLGWEPVGAVQGWDAQSYASAARQYVEMGYRYIALGGLARTKTEEILRILREVHEVVPPSVAIHLFGIARVGSMKQFASMGVRSVDSASHLRRAWLAADQNYFALDGSTYAAIRVPEYGKSFRTKQIVEERGIEPRRVRRLEEGSLKALRAFERGEISVEATLDVLDEYDHLLTPARRSMREAYRLTLEARPWRSCPCALCQQHGIDILIFRGNNRNRRRGFHNTYVFYRLLEKVLGDEATPYLPPRER